MLYHFEEYVKYAQITGFCNVDFQKAEAFLKTHRKQVNHTELQFFEADLVATEAHLYFAVLNALHAFRVKVNISKSVAMETMLFASAQRQIARAIEHIGIKPGSRNMAVVVIGDDPEVIEAQLRVLSAYLGCRMDETLLQLNSMKERQIQDAFEIGPEEISAVKGPVQQVLISLVVEHMALLSTQI
jgi:tRNA threonylcarbamoyladenosine modification (KEOPS) complex Cgi121 subunit